MILPTPNPNSSPNPNPSPDPNRNPNPDPNQLDDCLTVWDEVGGAARGSRLLIVADSCYSGKLISRLRDETGK